MQKNNYSLDIIHNLSNFKLTLFICEIGTNGLVSGLLAKTDTNHILVGSYIINNESMLKTLKIEHNSNPNEFIKTVSLTALRNFKADSCVTTYIKDKKLYISIFIYQKEYQKEIDLKNIDDIPEYATIQTLSFFSNLLNSFI
jgi:hypothetical protein